MAGENRARKNEQISLSSGGVSETLVMPSSDKSIGSSSRSLKLPRTFPRRGLEIASAMLRNFRTTSKDLSPTLFRLKTQISRIGNVYSSSR